MTQLNHPVTVLKGVGEKRQAALQTLGITTVGDLMAYYPFRYDDIQEKNLLEIQDQEKVVLKGTVISDAVVTHYGYRKSRLVFRMMIEQAVINVTFFNQPFLKKQISLSEDIAVFGKWDARRRALTGMKIIASKEGEVSDFAPIYHVNKHVRQSTLVDLIRQAFAEYGAGIEENLPQWLLEKYRLMPKGQAMFAMHFPQTNDENRLARRRLVFEEFFLFQLRMALLKQEETATAFGNAILYDVERLKQFTRQLPFELTAAQKRVINEICGDMRRPNHMHRLLQGDVGSGKTVVAAVSLYAAVTAGYQGALMVPTEILAEQHAESLQQLFEPFEVQTALLTSSTKAAEKKQILAGLENGSINVVVGTHSLIQSDVLFHRLGLVITDEQHRFGVNQRKILREKGDNPDVLFMTATPIPRTLAITAYGEMDVSIIDELPAGRIPVETRWIRPKQVDTVLEWMRKELRQGSQAYVICPLIEESEALDVKNATEIYEHLRAFFLPEFAVSLLHGKMKPQEKEAVMQSFKDNETQVLVSTTVIEVGVNVPNATIMMIMDADRFGLAQLHQLRGRVGRGDKASYCILVANPKGETGQERMTIMTETTDGFVLSEKDLEMRGPGDFFGSKQSGLPEFRVGDMMADAVILETARKEAFTLCQETNWQKQPANRLLAEAVASLAEQQTYLD